jgi:hypothetical protein
MVRSERQTFFRLPKSGAIMFTVKTYISSLHQLPKEDLENLATEVRSWPGCVGSYKGRDIWGTRLLDFCEKSSKPISAQ